MARDDKVTICTSCKMVWLFNPNQKPPIDICTQCGKPVIHTGLTAIENVYIGSVSKDRKFLLAMAELKTKDIIEFNMKISQFKTQYEQREAIKEMQKNQPKCPTCSSTNIRKIGSGERMASVLGFGLLSKKINKSWKCNSCGHTW